MNILVLNAGSSSNKCSLYSLGGSESVLPDTTEPVWEAEIDWKPDTSAADLTVTTAEGKHRRTSTETSRQDALAQLLETLWSGSEAVLAGPNDIHIVGHRVVHGGQEFQQPLKVTDAVIAGIARLSPLAPAHNPAALEGIETVKRLLGDVPQVAVFDTAFHRTIPDEAALYPVPYEWAQQGIRKYGFHGISYQYCTDRAADILQHDVAAMKIVCCHLGSGCSLAAIAGGRSIDTTMGFTPLDGLMMATRSGSVDPSILLYLLREGKTTVAELDDILNERSGLKGISGISGDMREIEAAVAAGNERAKLAYDMYIHRLCSLIGAMAASLGGLDVLIFTAGIGEHSAAIRAAVCERLQWLGIDLDTAKNEASPVDIDIASPESAVRILVIHTQEDLQIARECLAFIDPRRYEK